MSLVLSFEFFHGVRAAKGGAWFALSAPPSVVSISVGRDEYAVGFRCFPTALQPRGNGKAKGGHNVADCGPPEFTLCEIVSSQGS